MTRTALAAALVFVLASVVMGAPPARQAQADCLRLLCDKEDVAVAVVAAAHARQVELEFDALLARLQSDPGLVFFTNEEVFFLRNELEKRGLTSGQAYHDTVQALNDRGDQHLLGEPPSGSPPQAPIDGQTAIRAQRVTPPATGDAGLRAP